MKPDKSQDGSRRPSGRRGGPVWTGTALLILSLPGRATIAGTSEEDRKEMARAQTFIREEAARIRASALKSGLQSEGAPLQPLADSSDPFVDARRWKVSLADFAPEDAGRVPDPDRHALEAQAGADRVEARQLAFRGEHQRAMEKLARWVEKEAPEAVKEPILMDLVEYAFRLSDYGRSQYILKRLLANRPGNAALLCNQAAVYLQTGRYKEALALLESIDTGAIKRPALLAAVFFNRACAHCRLGQMDLAISALYTAFKAHPEATSIWLTDPQLDGLRSDPRYNVLERIALRQTTSPLKPQEQADLTLNDRTGAGTEKRARHSAFLSLDAW